MGQQVASAVTTCDADDGTMPPGKLGGPNNAPPVSWPPRDPNATPNYVDQEVGCHQRIDGVKQCMATGGGSLRPGTAGISEQMLVSHELLQAAKSGDAKGVALALEKNAWVETRRPLVMRPQKKQEGTQAAPNPNVGLTPLMYAAMHGNEECVRRLIYANANLNAVDEDGECALLFAAKAGNLEACKLLIKSKADVSIINDDGKSIMDVCDPEIQPQVLQLVQRRGGA